MELPTPLIDKAHQPRNFQFPQREFGKTSIVKRSFQQQWFDCQPWLHYDEDHVDITNHFSIQIHIISYIIA